jgi:hypothetical protein
MGTLKEKLKKIGKISKELVKKYWWVILIYYTLKGIAFLFVMWYFLNA